MHSQIIFLYHTVYNIQGVSKITLQLWWSQLTQNCMDHPYELSSAVVRTVLDLILMILACQSLLLMMMILDPVDHLQHNLPPVVDTLSLGRTASAQKPCLMEEE